MEVLLARENGFCFGVKKAVELTEAAAESGRQVFNLGQIVHNPKISERLAARGVKVIADPAAVEPGIVVIRAHGVPPALRARIEESGHECVDATCSLVLRAQRFTKQLADEGYQVIILGTADHPEVVGLVGFAGTSFTIVETKDEWEKLPKMKKAGVVSQSDVIVVVGGKNSANTRELVNLARMQGKTAYHIEHPTELEAGWLAGKERMGLIGGCSTPMDTLLEVKERAEALAG